MTAEGRRAAVFLDRDGVVNRRPPAGTYVTRVDEFDILLGAPGAIRRLNDAGFLVCLVTNQQGLALNALSEAGLRGIHVELERILSSAGARLAGIYVCPHDLEACCECRKPRPGMLLRATAENGIDLHRSWMIGDSESDIQAGKQARCRTILIRGGGALSGDAEVVPDFVVEDLPRAVDLILATSPEAGGGPEAFARAKGSGGH